MTYASIGTNTSGPEVTDVSPFGLWILFQAKEYFLGYEDFPWFLNAPVQQVFDVVEEGPDHLRWPTLDIDLTLDSIRDPGTAPLVYEPSGPYGQSPENANDELPEADNE